MTLFISHLHHDLRAARLTRRGSTHRAEDVPVGQHKSYPRFEKIRLPAPETLDATLADILTQRVSYLNGSEASSISLQQWGTFFGLALGKRKQSGNRNYPSGGALYPIETYLISSAVPGHDTSVFHYNPSEHALEKLWALPHTIALKDLVQQEKLLYSSLIVLTSMWKRSSAKYGDFAYTVGMLEAGHMSENMLLVATALDLHARPMAGFADAALLSALDISPEDEQPVHTITLY